MSKTDFLNLPKTGFAGLRQNWRHDLIAAFSVALVALPLGLGISIASGSAVPSDGWGYIRHHWGLTHHIY